MRFPSKIKYSIMPYIPVLLLVLLFSLIPQVSDIILTAIVICVLIISAVILKVTHFDFQPMSALYYRTAQCIFRGYKLNALMFLVNLAILLTFPSAWWVMLLQCIPAIIVHYLSWEGISRNEASYMGEESTSFYEGGV